jgi:hypothetical protein
VSELLNGRLGRKAAALTCAAARTVDLPLISRDTGIRASGAVKVIW